MKQRLFIIILTALCILSCSKENLDIITRYQGILMEQSEKRPLSNVLIMLTDGKQVFDSTRTTTEGKFYLTANWTYMNDNYCIYINGENRYPDKKVELTGTKQADFDFFYLYLYNKETIDAAPIINDGMTFNYSNGRLIFENILIKSEYTIKNAYLMLNSENGEEQKYELHHVGNGYSTTTNRLSTGTWYQWRVFAENEIDQTTTDYRELLFGFSTITPLPLSQATLNSVTAVCTIENNCPYSTTETGFCWGVEISPTQAEHTIKKNAANNSFSATIENLDFTITNYLWAYIRNQNGIAYSHPLILKAGNPLNFFEFTYNSNTYSAYTFPDKMNWYKAIEACENLCICFDDWFIPDYNQVGAYISTYINTYGFLPNTNIWTTSSLDEIDENRKETFLSTPNGLILENKTKEHSVIAIRKI